MLENLSISWTSWFTLIVFLVGLYFFTGFLIRLIRFNMRNRPLTNMLINGLSVFQVLLEPFGLGLILMAFALINPIIHGSLIVTILALAYLPLKNYLMGRFFMLNNAFSEKERISVNQYEGSIQSIERLGLLLQVQEGVKFINYETLMKDGFVKLEGDRLRGIKFLEIIPSPSDAHPNQILNQIKDKLFTCPYTDWFYHPDITTSKRADNSLVYKARLRVSKDQHLQHLIELVKEWGYDCRAVKN